MKDSLKRPTLEEENREMAFVAELTACCDRYEAIIKVRNARIKWLENGLLAIIVIESAGPRRRKLEIAKRIARAAIKEAT